MLADDDVLLREGLASLLDRSGVHVVGQAGEGPHLLALVRETRPDLAVVDLKLPDGRAVEILTQPPRPHVGATIAPLAWCRGRDSNPDALAGRGV